MTRMKSLTDHLAAIHARIKENAEKKLAAQPELDLGMDDQAAPEQAQPIPASDVDAPTAKPPKVRRERSNLLPSHHTDRDFFLCDLFDYAMKDDGVSDLPPSGVPIKRKEVQVEG